VGFGALGPGISRRGVDDAIDRLQRLALSLGEGVEN